MRHHRDRRPNNARPGVTLLELIVVIVLMGLVLAIAAPSFTTPAPAHRSPLATVVESARRAAILRAEPVTLSVDGKGAWRIDEDATPTAPPIAAGTLGLTVGRFRVRVSPLGTCLAEPATGAVDMNLIDCRLVAAGAPESPR